MTTKTASKAASNILMLTDNLQAVDGGMIQTQAFYDFLRFQRDVQEQIKQTWKEVENFMRANDIPTVKGDWGHMTISDGKTIYAYAEDILTDPIFYKKSLNTDKVKDHKSLFGSLPEGVTEGKGSPYLDKRINKKW